MTEYNKYKDIFFVEKYAALWSFGYLNGLGHSEGLYRTIAELGFRSLKQGSVLMILDVGCGVGRTASDYAQHFVNSTFIAIDAAELMISYAKKIVNSKETTNFDLGKIGFPEISIHGFGLTNVQFENKTLENFHLTKDGKQIFDLITCVNFIDRVNNVEANLRMIYDLLKIGGVCILASPLNFTNTDDWEKFGSVNLLKKIVEQVGFHIDICFDNFLYREILDVRGATENYSTVVMRLIKIK